MILDFGYVCMEIHTFLTEDLEIGHHLHAKKSALQIGGHAGLQSIAAARAGARVSLISALSNDFLSKTISDTLRREGIITAAMAQSEKETAVIQTIKSANGKITILETTGAHEDITSDQITKTILAPRHLILLHDNVPEEKNLEILKHAKEHSAKCVMTFCNEPPPALFEFLDIALVSTNTKHNTQADCHIIPVNPNGFDCFCGTFAACYQAQYPIARSIDYATCAQKLYSESENEGYTAMPYLGNIEDLIKKA